MDLVFFCVVLIFALASAQKIREFQVPAHADPRHPAELACHYYLPRQRLQSVKLYRDLDEIFRYTPTQQAQTRMFNRSDVVVQSGTCGEDWCTVQILPPPMYSRAAYTCEVSSEGPMFNIAKDTKIMTVIAMPERDPVITGIPAEVKPGELVVLNCSTAYSLPPAEITWLVDDQLQTPEVQHLSAPQIGGVRATWRALQLRAPISEDNVLRVRCDAVLPVDPPVVKSATTVVSLLSQAQRSQYVAENGSAGLGSSIFLLPLMWSVLKTIMLL